MHGSLDLVSLGLLLQSRYKNARHFQRLKGHQPSKQEIQHGRDKTEWHEHLKHRKLDAEASAFEQVEASEQNGNPDCDAQEVCSRLVLDGSEPLGSSLLVPANHVR